MWKKKKISMVWILILASVIAAAFHVVEWNARYKYPSTVFPLNRNITYSNVDNEYYLTPVDNYLKGIGWRRDPPVGNGSYFRRVPGYSLLYLFAREITPNIESALYVLIIIHSILYLLFLLAMSRTLYYLKIKNRVYNAAMLLLIIIPYFYHTLLITMTETISVYLMAYFMFFMIRGYSVSDEKKKLISYMLASFCAGYVTLTRPYLGIILVLLPVTGFIEYYKKGFLTLIKNYFIIGSIPILMIGGWGLRNYLVTHEFVLLERPYHPESLDRMKPEFIGFWNFMKGWGEDGIEINAYQLPMYNAALKGDTSYVYIENLLQHIPADVKQICGEQKIIQLLKRYQLVVYNQRIYFDRQIAMPSQYTKEELDLEKDFNETIKKYNNTHLFDHYVKYPLTYLRQIVFHSNTVGIYFLQEPFRKYWFLNVLRWMSAIIHISLFFFIFISMYTTRKNWLRFALFVLIPVLYLVFFCYFVQNIEQRYYSSFLPLLMVGAIYDINYIYVRYFEKNTVPRS